MKCRKINFIYFLESKSYDELKKLIDITDQTFLNITNENGDSVLHLLVQEANLNNQNEVLLLVQRLMEKGIDSTIVNQNFELATDILKQKKLPALNAILTFNSLKREQKIKDLVNDDKYRARLWQVNEVDNTLHISLKKIDSTGNEVSISQLSGNENYKINKIPAIDLKAPTDSYHKSISDSYTTIVDNNINKVKNI